MNLLYYILLLGPPFMTGEGLKIVHCGPKKAKHGALLTTSHPSTFVCVFVDVTGMEPMDSHFSHH